MTAENLNNEANRCFLCKNARCQKHCPINTPVPEIIKLYKEERFDEAGKILFENNPFSIVCAIVCPHEDQCYGNCIRNIKDVGVKFFEIEKFISEKYLGSLELKKGENNSKSIAIVGGGPAGITSALMLSQKGFRVTIFEAKEKIGGMLTYGIPEYRLDRKIIKKYEDTLINLGVKIRYSTLISETIDINKLKSEYDAVLISNGVWSPKSVSIKGETLGNCHYAIDYLSANKSYDLKEEVIVIGAGNVAMDAARTAKRNGSNVRVVYRKDECDMVATNMEIQEAKDDDVEFDFFKSPVEINKDGVVFVECRKEINEDKSFKMINIEDSEKLIKCDNVIIAIGQNPRNEITNKTSIETDRVGHIKVNKCGQTSIDGVFSAGDIVTGAKTVVLAVDGAKKVSLEIEKYLLNK
ncbi:MAG: NAD(P)-dependent oxidoreductase [Peptostreptococcaceae bacterium]